MVRRSIRDAKSTITIYRACHTPRALGVRIWFINARFDCMCGTERGPGNPNPVPFGVGSAGAALLLIVIRLIPSPQLESFVN